MLLRKRCAYNSWLCVMMLLNIGGNSWFFCQKIKRGVKHGVFAGFGIHIDIFVVFLVTCIEKRCLCGRIDRLSKEMIDYQKNWGWDRKMLACVSPPSQGLITVPDYWVLHYIVCGHGEDDSEWMRTYNERKWIKLHQEFKMPFAVIILSQKQWKFGNIMKRKK